MKNLLALTITLLLASTSISAENAQQTKMKDCNAQAKTGNLSGAARKSFMKTCLAGDAAGEGAKLNSQQQKMKDCNAQAKTKALKGADRKSFMSTCLKG